mmetsp:Transcript_43924/g.129357  ORF Transcript_43924/g.129357 Transcript_43924/m.129357 type:complete len:590 (-) Transcript_43924:23-1792(-)
MRRRAPIHCVRLRRHQLHGAHCKAHIGSTPLLTRRDRVFRGHRLVARRLGRRLHGLQHLELLVQLEPSIVSRISKMRRRREALLLLVRRLLLQPLVQRQLLLLAAVLVLAILAVVVLLLVILHLLELRGVGPHPGRQKLCNRREASLLREHQCALAVAITDRHVGLRVHQQLHQFHVASRRRRDESRVARVELVLILLVDVRLALDQDLAQVGDALARREEQWAPVAVRLRRSAADLGVRLALARVGLGPRVGLELLGQEDEVGRGDVLARHRERNLGLGDAAHGADRVGVGLEHHVDEELRGLLAHLAVLAHVGRDDHLRPLEDVAQELDLGVLQAHRAQVERRHLVVHVEPRREQQRTLVVVAAGLEAFERAVQQRQPLVHLHGQLDPVEDDRLLEPERHAHGAREVLVVVVPLGREGVGARLEALFEQHRRGLGVLGLLLELLLDLHGHAVAHVHDHLAPLRDDLLECERVEVNGEAHVEHERLDIHLRFPHLETRQRREEDLGLMRVLRDPDQLRAAIGEAHLHLEDRPRGARAVVHRDRALASRRREAILDAASNALSVALPDGIGKLGVAHATVDFGGDRQLG